MALLDYRTEFPDFGELDVALPEGFADQSWRQDACPCFINEELLLAVYTDYVDKELREHPEIERFSLHRMLPDPDHGPQVSGDLEPVLSTDDWSDIVAVVETVRAAAQSAKPAI